MPKPKKITHHCSACNKKHSLSEDDWEFWSHKIDEHDNDVWWCNKGIDCAGCQKVHKKNGQTKLVSHPSGKTIYLCAKWAKFGNGQIDWDTWSPQEVMSGVHLGMERDKVYGADTENHDIVQSEQEEAMDQALTELQEAEAEDRVERW